MAAKAHSPSPHLTPCYSLYYPKKRVCCSGCLNFAVWAVGDLIVQGMLCGVPASIAVVIPRTAVFRKVPVTLLQAFVPLMNIRVLVKLMLLVSTSEQ